VKEQTLQEEFKSYVFLDRVLERAGWKQHQDIKRRLNEPALFVAAGDANNGRALDQVRKEAQDEQQELIEQVRSDKHFGVSVLNNAAGELLVSLSLKWFDPKSARDFVLEARRYWVSKRDEEYKRYYRNQLDDAEKSLEQRRREYETALTNLEQFERQNDVSFLNEENTDAKLMSDLKIQLSSGEANVTELEVRVRGLEERKARTPPTIKVANEEINPAWSAAKSMLDEQEKELATQLELKQENHPDVEDQRKRVEEARKAWDAVKDNQFLPSSTQESPNAEWVEITKALAIHVPELQGLKERQLSLDSEMKKVAERLKKQPMIQNTLKRLNNDYLVAQEALNAAQLGIQPLREKVIRWEGQAVGLYSDPESDLKQTGAYEVLEDPYEASKPTGLPKAAIALIGLLGGLGLGFALMFLGELMRSTFNTADEVQFALGVPVLAAIGRISTAAELRTDRVRALASVTGALLLVAALGGFVALLVIWPQRLPPIVQEYLTALKSALQ
jgi:uncharacterized protein involved in exopolysaccharide biosynthesis